MFGKDEETMEDMKRAPWCCYVESNGADCGANATHEVGPEEGDAESFTHSCVTHISALFSTNGWHLVRALEGEERGDRVTARNGSDVREG
jgi:hypothetical protein